MHQQLQSFSLKYLSALSRLRISALQLGLGHLQPSMGKRTKSQQAESFLEHVLSLIKYSFRGIELGQEKVLARLNGQVEVDTRRFLREISILRGSRSQLGLSMDSDQEMYHSQGDLGKLCATSLAVILEEAPQQPDQIK